MLIDEQALQHWIENFYGYGSWHARYWFIGYEEGGGDLPEEVSEKVNYFKDIHQVNVDGYLCNIRELYKHVTIRLDGTKSDRFNNRYEYRFDANAVQHGVWKNLIAFTHGYENKPLPDLLEYQKHNFAAPSENKEALIQLYPLPSPHNHAWYYSWLDMPRLTFLKSRELYEERVFENRIQTITSNIIKYKPELVLMYGMNNINALKDSFQKISDGLKFKLVKAIKQQIPQHHRATVGSTTILITTQIPALRHGRIETGFDWEQFGKQARSSC
jgi:hypothetical protein